MHSSPSIINYLRWSPLYHNILHFTLQTMLFIGLLLRRPSPPGWDIVNKDIVSGPHLRDPGVWVAGITPSYESCRQICAANSSCTAFDWAGHGTGGTEEEEGEGEQGCYWDSTCYFRSDGLWLPHVNGKCNHTSGRRHVGPQPQCPTVTCTDDSDCVSVTNCTWCRDDVPGVGHPQLCGGAPSPTVRV